MPQTLRNKIAISLRKSDISKITIFNDMSESYVGFLVRKMQVTFASGGSMVYMPYEGSNGIYFNLNGHLVHQMRTAIPINSSMRHLFAFEEIPKSWLNPGDIFGHEELQGDLHIGIKASSNCELYVLKFKEIRDIAHYFPPVFKVFADRVARKLAAQKMEHEKKTQGRGLLSFLPTSRSTRDLGAMEAGTESNHDEKNKPTTNQNNEGVGFDLQYRKFLYTAMDTATTEEDRANTPSYLNMGKRDPSWPPKDGKRAAIQGLNRAQSAGEVESKESSARKMVAGRTSASENVEAFRTLLYKSFAPEPDMPGVPISQLVQSKSYFDKRTVKNPMTPERRSMSLEFRRSMSMPAVEINASQQGKGQSRPVMRTSDSFGTNKISVISLGETEMNTGADHIAQNRGMKENSMRSLSSQMSMLSSIGADDEDSVRRIFGAGNAHGMGINGNRTSETTPDAPKERLAREDSPASDLASEQLGSDLSSEHLDPSPTRDAPMDSTAISTTPLGSSDAAL